MNKYSVASLTVAMQPEGKTLLAHSGPYKTFSRHTADIEITVNRPFLLCKQKENSHLSIDVCEYIYTGAQFYRKLLDFGGFLLHASAVYLDGEAYLFSAKSGVGKSTHSALWLKYFGTRAHIINDDKPALRIINGAFKVCGTPWSGKTNLSTNEIVPLKAIAFLERGITNEIKRINTKEALCLILGQTLRLPNKIDKLLKLIDILLTDTPVYKLRCNMSPQAVECAYNTMKRRYSL